VRGSAHFSIVANYLSREFFFNTRDLGKDSLAFSLPKEYNIYIDLGKRGKTDEKLSCETHEQNVTTCSTS